MVTIHQEAFEKLKLSILDATMLYQPNETFILDTDDSDKSIGAELCQIQVGVEKNYFFC